MILKRLTLANFRQFAGVQRLEFAQSDGGGSSNVTVIFGENGRGKTGIFRAVMFCLFGERRLPQDGDVEDGELQLVNEAALQRSAGRPVDMSVELEFSHRDRQYSLKRSMVGLRVGDRTDEEFTGVRLATTEPDGNCKSETDPSAIDPAVGAILDRRVKDYFLFDGEKIERLTRASAEQRREIARGIRNLLSVDALETAQRAVQKLARKLDDELARTESPELARLVTRLRENEDAEDQKRQRAEEVAKELALAADEMVRVDRDLRSFEEIRGLLEQRKTIEQRMADLEQQAAERLDLMKPLLVRAASVLVAPTLLAVFTHIEQQKQRGDIPSEIRRDLIERILSEGRCICGREVCKSTEAHARILEWLGRTADVTVQDAALNLWRHLSEVRSRLADDAGAVESALIGYGSVRTDIDRTRQQLERVRREIGGAERKDATKLDQHRKHLEEKRVRLEAEAMSIRNDIETLRQEQSQISVKLRDEKLRSDRHDDLLLRATLARETHEALQEIHGEFTQEIKERVGEEATALFQNLLDLESREALRSIAVNDDYSLQVLDRWGRPFLANISAGQRQVMSIAFIAALARVASGEHLLEMPLFMDTPFGRLSYEHRRNLIEALPSLASQWVLLATDTEFRRQEADLLRRSGRWGRFFVLRADGEGSTAIEEHDISLAHAMLNDEVDDQ